LNSNVSVAHTVAIGYPAEADFKEVAVKLSVKVIALLVVIPALIGGAAFAEEPSPAMPQASVQADSAAVAQAPADLSPQELLRQKDEELLALKQEHALIREKLSLLETTPSLTRETLTMKNLQRLKGVAADVKAQRQTMAEFETFVTWMTSNLSGYSRYIEAGSVAAGFARVLPIPYAGQASLFTKFVSDAAVSLGAASVSINKYLATSQQFLARVDALDPVKGANPQEVSALVRFADQDLLRGMMEVQERLVTTSHLTTSTLSFLESLNHYVGSTDEYWAKTKSLLSSDEKKDKSFLSESTTTLRNKAQAFNGKFLLFDGTVKKAAPQIKSLVAYDDLIREIDPKVAKLK